MHDTYSRQTLLDLNRAGTPLIEIISDPDMHSCDQAAAYVRKVQSILRCVGSSDADMEKVGFNSADKRPQSADTSDKGVYANRRQHLHRLTGIEDARNAM